ncbi:hypothetical protein [Chloroflexus sp.]|uniref:hypothetical protein n=1 Tax=Chloroflexus sp. TaxID=1904827 RepID=UPI002ADE53D7|nr:hypothetical protein [Chloroflexus sp.]
MIRVVLALLIVTGLFALVNPVGSVAAQSSSPTIGQIQANPNAFIDQVVTISGRSGIYVDEDEFILDDGTGQIVVDTPSSAQLITIPVGTSITVVGQIDWIGSPSSPRGVDLDACRITLPDRTIDIRDCSFGSSVPANPPPSQSPPANQSNSPTIGQIQANPNAFLYQIVTISGNSGVYVDENEFMLDDGSGQIVVDPGPPRYQRINIPVGTPITVVGQIDWMGPPQARRGIDLDACRIITPDRTIEIRDCSFNGPPPWAGGPNRGRGRP